jgi:hypothetical protein
VTENNFVHFTYTNPSIGQTVGMGAEVHAAY